MVNGGYMVKAKIVDAHFNLMRQLIDIGYLADSRSKILTMIFQIRWGPAGAPIPTQSTRVQIAYVVGLYASGAAADQAHLTFIAIDPPAWFLSTGDASGACYRGKISQVISQVVEKYAPDIELLISATTDSDGGRYWMMRQDPRTFIASLLSWSSSLTQRKTSWLVAPDGLRLMISEQAQIPSTARAFYRYWDGVTSDTIKSWQYLGDNSSTIIQSKLVTAGMSAVSGQYLDKITDKNEQFVFAKDSTTPNKRIARVSNLQSFAKPTNAVPPLVGWTAIPSIPEVYSGGESGLQYQDYIDGQARALWLGLTTNAMRMKLKVLGHGEWSDCFGLGVDTVYLKWLAATSPNGDQFWFMTGNWIAYGFHHIVTPKFWTTDLYLTRYDFDASGVPVGGSGL